MSPHCSFCYLSADQVDVLVVSEAEVYICGACVEVCAQAIAEFRFDEAGEHFAAEPA